MSFPGSSAESQRDAGMKKIATENTPVHGGDVTADDTEVVSVGNVVGIRDTFENVHNVVGEDVVVEVFDMSSAQHFFSSALGAVSVHPDRTQPKMTSSDHMVLGRRLFCGRRTDSSHLFRAQCGSNVKPRRFGSDVGSDVGAVQAPLA